MVSLRLAYKAALPRRIIPLSLPLAALTMYANKLLIGATTAAGSGLQASAAIIWEAHVVCRIERATSCAINHGTVLTEWMSCHKTEKLELRMRCSVIRRSNYRTEARPTSRSDAECRVLYRADALP